MYRFQSASVQVLFGRTWPNFGGADLSSYHHITRCEGTSPFDEVDASERYVGSMHTPAWPCEQAGGMPQQGRWRLEQGFCGKFCLHWRRTHQRCGGSTLKMEERRGLLATEACKQVVQDDKAALDQHHLQLQNLLYERNHLLREIERCKSFR